MATATAISANKLKINNKYLKVGRGGVSWRKKRLLHEKGMKASGELVALPEDLFGLFGCYSFIFFCVSLGVFFFGFLKLWHVSGSAARHLRFFWLLMAAMR